MYANPPRPIWIIFNSKNPYEYAMIYECSKISWLQSRAKNSEWICIDIWMFKSFMTSKSWKKGDLDFRSHRGSTKNLNLEVWIPRGIASGQNLNPSGDPSIHPRQKKCYVFAKEFKDSCMQSKWITRVPSVTIRSRMVKSKSRIVNTLSIAIVSGNG